MGDSLSEVLQRGSEEAVEFSIFTRGGLRAAFSFGVHGGVLRALPMRKGCGENASRRSRGIGSWGPFLLALRARRQDDSS